MVLFSALKKSDRRVQNSMDKAMRIPGSAKVLMTVAWAAAPARDR